MKKTLVLATHNPGKLTELQSILTEFNCISQDTLKIPEVEETGLSFIENAIIKARHASRLSNNAALADDSGLVVPALDGEPGIFSARYAGPSATAQDNMQHLLQRLTPLSPHQRRAYFYCAIVLVTHADDPTPLIATGQCFGEICAHPQGDQGFGYDPLFYVPAYKATFAQLPSNIKNAISHRARALNHFREQWTRQQQDLDKH